MMKLTVFVLTALAAFNAAPAQTVIADGIDDLEGTWTYYAGGSQGTYVCTWVSGHNFSCAVSFAYGGGTCHVTYATTLYAAGWWTYTSSYNSGTCPTNGIWSASILALVYDFCDREFVSTCTNGYNYFRTTGANSATETNQGISTKIEVPGTVGTNASSGGENSTVDKGEYRSVNYEGESFSATLKDPGNAHHNFAGHLTHEVLSLLSNTCNFVNVGAGSYWTPDQTNDYSVGNANYGSGDVTEYDTLADTPEFIIANQRSYRISLPCSVTVDQQMTLDLPSDSGTVNWVYEDHDLVHQIGNGWVKDTRNGVGTQRNFGQKRSVWRTDDWMTFCLSITAPCM